MKDHYRTGDEEFSDFYLLGHTFSSYITTNYALSYPTHVRKLLLSSPFGMMMTDDDTTAFHPSKYSGKSLSE